MFTLCMLWLQIKVGGWVTAGYETLWRRYDIFPQLLAGAVAVQLKSAWCSWVVLIPEGVCST